MQHYTLCKSCKKEILVKASAATRPDLEMEKGEKFEVNCQQCGARYHIHVNDVRARENKVIIAGGVVLTVGVTAFLWMHYGAVSTLTMILPMLFWGQQTRSAQLFNAYKI